MEVRGVQVATYKEMPNIVAYELSHHDQHDKSSAVWLAGVPKYIKHLVLRDCNAATIDNQ